MSLGNRQAEVLQRIHRGGLCVGEDVRNLAGAIGGLGGGFVHLGGDCGEARHVGEVTHVVVRGLELSHDILSAEVVGPLLRGLGIRGGGGHDKALGDKVKEVRASARLKSPPVCLTAGEGLSFEMEKYFQAVQPDSGIKADRILELNVEHPAFAALEAAVTADPEKAKKYAALFYDQALLIAGLPLEDPAGYTDLVCELMK